MKTKTQLLQITLIFLMAISTGLHAQNWFPLTSGVTNSLIGVSAPSALVCYVSGGAGTILKTTDGGLSWVQQTSGTAQDLYGITFTDINNGYAVGNAGAALKTTDGGATWLQMAVGTSVSFRRVYFLNATTGFITGGPSGNPGTILKTTDVGNTWVSLPTAGASTNTVYSIAFTTPTVGYANDWDGNIIKTTNGGTSWSLLSATGITALSGGLYFTTATTGFVLGQNGVILKTTNSGANWFSISSNTTDAYSIMDFYDANHGYVAGGNVSANTASLLTTSDAGSNWSPVTLGTSTPRLIQLDFFDQSTGYAVGLNGTILKYSNCAALTSGVTEYTDGNNVNAYEVFAAYPNPFSAYSIIDLSSYHFDGAATIELYDITGKLLMRNENITKDKFILNRNSFVSGFYFFTIYDSQKIAGIGKLIID